MSKLKKIPVRQLAEAQNRRGALEMFDIRRVGDLFGDREIINHELHRHDFHFILALEEGKGTHEIDFISYELSGHSVFVLRPGQVHQLTLMTGCSGYLLEFNNEFYHPETNQSARRLRKAGNRNYFKAGPALFNKLGTILSSVFNEYREKMDGYQDVIKANLDIFFVELMRQGPGNDTLPIASGSYSQERLEEFLEHLEAHVTEHKQVSYYTGIMNLSAYQLNEITKTLMNKTASDVINDHIVLEAKRQLLATGNQVKEIAYQLGYEDVSYFIRFFKRHTGLSPDMFRSRFR